MSSVKQSELHEVLKDPLRQRILLKLGQYNRIDFNGLMKNLKLTNSVELNNQLNILQEMVLDGEHIVSKQENLYQLTEKGHYVLDEMIAFPDLESDNYREKVLGETNQSSNPSKTKPKWFSLYWIGIFVSTIIVVGIVIPVFGHQPFDKVLFYLIAALLILGFGYYIRVKQPSMKTNRLIYIVLFGGFFGCWFSIGAIIVLSRMGFHEIDAVVISAWIGCFALGGILGDLIGRIRHYKGPGQYSP